MIRLGTPVHRFDELPSTMDELDRLARAGAPEGTAVITAQQVAGRGRAGRSWITAPGSAFLCSLLLRPPLPPRQITSLPLIAGQAIAEAIEALTNLPATLKWPNDVFVGAGKVCGVLAQSRTSGDRIEFVNLGFGINVNALADQLPDGATSLRIETGEAISLESVEQSVFGALEHRYVEFVQHGGRPPLNSWTSRAMFIGENVVAQTPSGEVSGRFTGVDPDGAALIETSEGPLRLAIGELTRGPRPVAAPIGEK